MSTRIEDVIKANDLNGLTSLLSSGVTARECYTVYKKMKLPGGNVPVLLWFADHEIQLDENELQLARAARNQWREKHDPIIIRTRKTERWSSSAQHDHLAVESQPSSAQLDHLDVLPQLHGFPSDKKL